MNSIPSLPSLDQRVASLEGSLRRTRVLALALGAAWLWLALAGFARQTQEEVVTQRLVLTDAADSAVVVLVAGPESSLVVQTPAGTEVVRLGGPAARRIGH
jgi:hypothetical protein